MGTSRCGTSIPYLFLFCALSSIGKDKTQRTTKVPSLPTQVEEDWMC